MEIRPEESFRPLARTTATKITAPMNARDAAEEAGLAMDPDETHQNATDERPDETPEDDVPQRAVAAALHDFPGQPASDQPRPCNQVGQRLRGLQLLECVV